MIQFIIDEEGCEFCLYKDNLHDFSESTKSVLLKFSKCAYCCNNIKKDFSPCECVAKDKKNRCAGWYRITREQYESLNECLQKDRWRANNRRRHAVRKEQLSKAGGRHTDEDIYRIWKLQNGECYFCWNPLKVSFPELDDALPWGHEKDHLTPVSKDGTDWPYNIALVCKECNKRKSDRNEASFWRLLEKEHGEKWVSEHKSRATKNRGAKLKLTNIRKKQAKQKFYNKGKAGGGIKKRKP